MDSLNSLGALDLLPSIFEAQQLRERELYSSGGHCHIQRLTLLDAVLVPCELDPMGI